jgi:hypothetical protein
LWNRCGHPRFRRRFDFHDQFERRRKGPLWRRYVGRHGLINAIGAQAHEGIVRTDTTEPMGFDTRSNDSDGIRAHFAVFESGSGQPHDLAVDQLDPRFVAVQARELVGGHRAGRRR